MRLERYLHGKEEDQWGFQAEVILLQFIWESNFSTLMDCFPELQYQIAMNRLVPLFKNTRKEAEGPES